MGYQHWPTDFPDEYKTPLLEKTRKKRSLIERIPARYVLTLLTFLGLGIQYTQRVNLSVTMVAMVNSTFIEGKENDTTLDECPNIFSAADNVTRPYKEGKFTWSPSTQGIILGAFYYGYICTPLLGGRLSELVGAKWLLGGGIFFTSLLTLITPYAAELGVAAMVALRVIIGAAQGVNSASMYAMFSRWAPTEERSRLLSICTIGQHVGTIVTMPVTGFLIQYDVFGGWPSAFYLFGCIGCVWFVFWVFLVYNTPAEHPRISKRELMYIQQNLPQVSAERNNRPIPWGKIVRSKAVWAVTVAKFAGTWGFTCLLTKLPAYLADVLHFPIQKNGMINALVYTAEIAAMFLSGCSSDYIRKKNWLSNTNIRKLFETLALMGPTICLVLIPAMGCNHWPVVTLIIMSMGFYGMVGGGDIPAFVDIAPELAGTIFGLANGIAGTTGFLSPLVAGIFLDKDHGGMFQWSKVFYTSCGIYAGGALVFLIFGSAEPEPWAVSQEEPTSSGEYSRKASVRSDIEISLSIHASCPR
ncbi:Sialin, partial [Stegodyphus mimosarum]